MKIGLVTNIYDPYDLGGTEVYVKTLTKAIKEKGHDVFVITTCPLRRGRRSIISETVDEIKVYRFYPLNVYWGYRAQEKSWFLKPLWHLVEQWNPHVYFTVQNILAEESPEVVHIHNLGGFSNSIFWACKKSGRKVVYTLHDYISVCPKSILLRTNFELCQQSRLPCRVYQMIKHWSLSTRVDLFVSPSLFNAELHREHEIAKNGRYVVVPPGIATTSMDLGGRIPLEHTRSQDNYLDVLYLGQVVRHKGLALLAEAFKMVNRDDLRLHIAGNGDYAEQLRRELSNWSNVHFYGYVSGEAKADLLARSDAFVLPSICYDNAPLAIPEAYRYGLPVIGSRIGGIPEMIQENKTGFLFNSGDVSGLVSLLRSISLEKLRAMSHNCRKAAEKYGMETHLEKLLALYCDLVKLGGEKEPAPREAE